jgi:Condensation domain/TubC N-terminal docking domain
VKQEHATADDLRGLIQRLRSKGVVLYAEQTGLRYRAPRGTLTREEWQALNRETQAIALLLEQDISPPSAETPKVPLLEPGRAPLSFAQLVHWRLRSQTGGRPIRQIVSVNRLHGPLRVECLEESICEVVHRHEALRTHIVLRNGMLPLQEVVPKAGSRLDVIRPTPRTESSWEAEVTSLVQDAVLDADDYATSPLFRAMLLPLDKSEHVLILSLDHIISDGVSLNILLKEILTRYTQLTSGDAIELPRVPVTLADYATRQHLQSAETFIKPARRFCDFGRTCFPGALAVDQPPRRSGWGLIRFTLSRDLCDVLRASARRNRTTLVMTAFAAYAALVLRWCGVKQTVVQFMTDGRTAPELSFTVGCLAFPIHVRVDLAETDNFIDLLRRITEEYCRAWDEADFGYAHTQIPRPEFTYNTMFNWLPTDSASCGEFRSGSQITWSCSRMDFARQILKCLRSDQEPTIAFQEIGGAITVDVMYPDDRFSYQTMQKFARNVELFIRTMAQAPNLRINDVNMS